MSKTSFFYFSFLAVILGSPSGAVTTAECPEEISVSFEDFDLPSDEDIRQNTKNDEERKAMRTTRELLKTREKVSADLTIVSRANGQCKYVSYDQWVAAKFFTREVDTLRVKTAVGNHDIGFYIRVTGYNPEGLKAQAKTAAIVFERNRKSGEFVNVTQFGRAGTAKID